MADFNLRDLLNACEPARKTVSEAMEEALDFVNRYNHGLVKFKPGDLIVWKKGMKNMTRPAYGEPIMVLEVFDGVRHEPDGTAYAAEPATVRAITHFGLDGDAFIHAFDARRFELYQK